MNLTESCGRKKTRRGVGRWVHGRSRCGDRSWRSAVVEFRGLTRITGEMEKLGWASNWWGRHVDVWIRRTMGGGGKIKTIGFGIGDISGGERNFVSGNSGVVGFHV